MRATLTTTTKKHNGAASATSNAGATQADQLEILLFGQPSIKARQMQESPPRRNKGKGRATDDSGDDLTSPDIPLRQMELVTRRPASRAHQKLAGDAIELDVGASTSGHSWRTSQNEPHRSKPIRAPDPHADLVIEVENDMQDLSSSPPTGSIFISQLPKNIQKGCKYMQSSQTVH